MNLVKFSKLFLADKIQRCVWQKGVSSNDKDKVIKCCFVTILSYLEEGLDGGGSGIHYSLKI